MQEERFRGGMESNRGMEGKRGDGGQEGGGVERERERLGDV